MNLLRQIPALAVVALSLAGCSPVDAINAAVPTGHLEIVRDEAYGPHPRQKIDVYRPLRVKGARSLPVIVFFYGGGWTAGERGDYLFAAEALARRGFVVAVPDYRLYPEVRFPAFVEDGARAVQWIAENSSRFGADEKRIFLAGHSAGAHIAALLAYDPRYLTAAGVDPAAIRGFAGLAGPYWFRTWTLPAYAPVFTGAAREETRPFNFAGPGDPPSLLLHGREDTTVKPTNSVRLADRLKRAGVRVETEFYKDVEHLKIIGSLASPLPVGPPVADRIAAFFKSIQAARRGQQD